MKRSTLIPTLITISAISIGAFFFNARVTNQKHSSTTVVKNIKKSTSVTNKKEKALNTEVTLDYDSDFRLIFRNNLRSFTQNIFTAYFPDSIELQKFKAFEKQIDTLPFAAILARGWCYHGQKIKINLRDLKFNFPQEDRYTVTFKDNKKINIKIDYATVPLYTGRVVFSLYPNRGSWGCKNARDYKFSVDLPYIPSTVEFEARLKKMFYSDLTELHKKDPELDGFKSGLQVKDITKFEINLNIFGNVMAQAAVDSAGELDLSINIPEGQNEAFEGGDILQYSDWWFNLQREHYCSSDNYNQTNCNYYTKSCPTFSKCVTTAYLSSFIKRKETLENVFKKVINRALKMLAPRSKTVNYAGKDFNVNFELSEFETSEADETMYTTWNLNYKTKQKVGEICGKELNFPSNNSFDEPNISDADFQFQISNRTFINFFKAMTKSGIMCQFFSKAFDGDDLIKFKPIFSGDFLFEPYEEDNGDDKTQGIKVTLPFQFGFYTDVGNLINFTNDETISGNLVVVYEVIDSCAGLTFGLKSFELEDVQGTMEISGTVTNPTLEGSEKKEEFKESWGAEFIKNFGRISIATKTINVPEYEYDFSLDANNLEAFVSNDNVIYDQEVTFSFKNEERNYIIGVNEFSPLDNSMSFGMIFREGNLDCCTEFGNLSCSADSNNNTFGNDTGGYKKKKGNINLNKDQDELDFDPEDKNSELQGEMPY